MISFKKSILVLVFILGLSDSVLASSSVDQSPFIVIFFFFFTMSVLLTCCCKLCDQAEGRTDNFNDVPYASSPPQSTNQAYTNPAYVSNVVPFNPVPIPSQHQYASPHHNPVQYNAPQYAPHPPQYTPQPPQYAPQPSQFNPQPSQYAPQPSQYAPQAPQFNPAQQFNMPQNLQKF